MPLTVANTEKMIVRSLGKLMAVVGLDATTVDGTNPDLALPVSLAAAEMGQAVADVTTPVDADLAGILPGQIPEFLSRVRLHTLKAARAAWTRVDIQEQDYSEKFSQLGDRIDKQIEDLVAELSPEAAAEAAQGGYPRVGEIKAGTCDYRVWPPGLFR